MRKVLIVDDEENIRFSFGSILTDAGFDVVAAANLNEAKEILDATRLDVALVDRLLESDDGMMLVEHINKVQPGCTTIVVSAFPTFKSASLGFDNKIFAYLEKPVRKTKLCKTVKAAAQNSHKKRSLQKNEQQLIQAQKMTNLGMLSSGIVHDFNNLFMVINGYIDLLSIDLPQKTSAMEDLGRIREVSLKGQNLSKKILSYIKQKDTKPEQVQIHTLVKEALAFLRLMLPKTISVTEKLENRKDTVKVHAAQIEQVILNIGINAMHAMEDRAGTIEAYTDSVTLGTDELDSLQIDTSECIKIVIKDTGCGMDEEIMDQMFDPFFSTRPKGFGTGIGLSTAYKIIKDHGGNITADSRPGMGSSFYIYLPKMDELNQN